MSGNKSRTGNSGIFRLAMRNPFRKVRDPRKPKKEKVNVVLKAESKEVVVIIDEKGPRIADYEVIINEKEFCVEKPYENVSILIKQGISYSSADLNKLFLEAQG